MSFVETAKGANTEIIDSLTVQLQDKQKELAEAHSMLL